MKLDAYKLFFPILLGWIENLLELQCQLQRPNRPQFCIRGTGKDHQRLMEYQKAYLTFQIHIRLFEPPPINNLKLITKVSEKRLQVKNGRVIHNLLVFLGICFKDKIINWSTCHIGKLCKFLKTISLKLHFSWKTLTTYTDTTDCYGPVAKSK